MCAEGEVPETVGLLEAEGSSTWAGGWGGSCWTAWKREQGTYLTAALMSLGERLPRCGNVDMPSILPPGCTVVMCLLEALLAVHTGPDHVLLCPLLPPHPLVSFS